MKRKRVNLTIDENWIKIAKKYAIDHNTSISRIFETALKKMMRVEKEKTATTEDLNDIMHKVFKRIDVRTNEIKQMISDTKHNDNTERF